MEVITLNNPTREEIQDKVTHLMELCNNGIFDISVRFGKTRPVIKYIEDSNPGQVLWVVPSVEARDTSIPSEFEKLGKSDLLKKVKVITWNMLPKIKDGHFDLAILDEVHRITQLSTNFFKNNSVDKVFCLTGTMPTSWDKLEILRSLGLDVILKVDMEKGIELDAVAPFNVNIVSFSSSDLSHYRFLTDRIGSMVNRGLIVPKELRFSRMRVVHNLASRKASVKRLLSTVLKDKRILIFCPTIAQTKEYCTHVYHTQSTDKDFVRFQEGKINHLAIVEKVTEAVTFQNMDGCVIVSPDGSTIKMIQKIGRTLVPRPGYSSKVYIFCAEDTVQKGWVDTALADIDKSRVKTIMV